MSLRLLGKMALYSSFGGLVGYKVNHALQNGFFYDTPTKGTDKALRYAEKLESKLESLPLVKQLSRDPQFQMVRPWDYVKEEKIGSIFTSGPLHTPGGVSIPPLLFANESERSIVTVVHCGHFLAGFPFLVHGGILSTALDEALHRTASLSLGTYPKETARINLSYKRPTFVNQFLVIKTSTEMIEEGKKARIIGSVRTLKGKELVRGEGVFDVTSPPAKSSWKSIVGL
ncbi:Fmp10p [Sugiyamaella lignohabitans]|uniref:Fmp10p n=1 Tax=Sugiyamaella lignohabitans TaxID=796027 RepID=A0A167FS42_9ASCO|nr:Fmp10p [Sugiyamaella lignohabitans]ANB15632.1 Fmp10p [Sugiyamaella lignohabitans]